ncbi:hypothetical protein GCM10011414_17120 [Croceivirga lutea]|uniref:DUF547 domain-containing protein n=1 Tax=Croceivirga lutea TaxID=1775167 RepID=UPI001639A7BF|nr:DUF547 domain-containing protein [Croceivirga lutea]GGG47956.1 hypothetical protein GCM10011414_17120 [Croceivirga lutea]
MYRLFLSFLLLLSIVGCKVKRTELSQQNNPTNLNTLSERLLQNIIEDKDTKALEEELANISFDTLDSTLRTDAQKYAFWLNIYNAYIQIVLTKNPDLYKDRRDFFSREQLKIAGEQISFEKIEHGILRKSQWGFGLGYVRKWFPEKFERKLRVSKRDFRIHFALNCGAKDCPPVAVYTPERLEEQLEKGTERYLKQSSDYDKATNTAKVTSLFNWFRGDFGGKSGVKKILKSYKIIDDTKDVSISYKNYDWTLDLDNFITL